MPRYVLLVIATLALLVRPAHAEEKKTIVALLPLDAEARLAIYGQPVAAEIAKVLTGTEITLIVVGARMAVPADAELIVDGTIEHDKASNKLALALRIRQKSDGATVGDDVGASAIGLPNLDKAAADVAQKLLVELRKLHVQRITPTPVEQPVPPAQPAVTPPALRATLVAVLAANPANSSIRTHVATELASALNRARRVGEDVPPMKMARTTAVKTVKASGHDLGLLLEIGDYNVSRDPVPLARARVHVRVVDGEKILFDRIIVTDSVVGERNITPDALAARTAREVITILGPHLRREVPAWR